MCRSIRPLFNFEPPATDTEIRAACLQFVRKVTGTTKPSKRNEPAFHRAVEELSATIHTLLDDLVTNSPPKDRENVAERAREKALLRFGPTR